MNLMRCSLMMMVIAMLASPMLAQEPDGAAGEDTGAASESANTDEAAERAEAAEDARPSEGTVIRREEGEAPESLNKLREEQAAEDAAKGEEIEYRPTDSRWFTYPDFPIVSARYRFGYDERENFLHDFEFGIAQEVALSQRTGDYEVLRTLRPTLFAHFGIGEIGDRVARRYALLPGISYHWDMHGASGESVRTDFPYLRTSNFSWSVGSAFGPVYSESVSPIADDDVGFRGSLLAEAGLLYATLGVRYGLELYQDGLIEDFEVTLAIGQPYWYGSVELGYRALRQPDERDKDIHHCFTIGLRFLV